MKKVNIVCVGKIKEKYFSDGIAEYVKRLGKYCDIKITELNDYPDKSDSVRRESENILTKICGYVILTDIGGETVSSEELSKLFSSVYSSGKSEITIIIGGSSGVSGEVKKAADKLISFGRMTFPHQLMRLILTEQIYRAFTIEANTPYHK